MKILHIFPKNDTLISQHVRILVDGLSQRADIRMVDNFSAFKQHLQTQEPDILHCHGCWNYTIARAAKAAQQQNARIILTPHGQLEPWIVSQQNIHEKISKELLWQKRMVTHAYCLIALGKLERENLNKLGWNHRTEEIHNAVTTNTITHQEMCDKTYDIYQKVIDSNTLELMDELSCKALAVILKAGITGDSRWCKSLDAVKRPQDIDWRRLLLYAEHENIRNYVDYGISILGLPEPDNDIQPSAAYFPDTYQTPKPLKEIIGEYQGNETTYLVKMIKQLHKQPLLLHMIEFTRELMRDTVNDDQLKEALAEKRLGGFAGSLMQVLSEQTQLDEGYMPIPPLDNRQTRQIRRLITNHLKI